MEEMKRQELVDGLEKALKEEAEARGKLELEKISLQFQRAKLYLEKRGEKVEKKKTEAEIEAELTLLLEFPTGYLAREEMTYLEKRGVVEVARARIALACVV